jgi:3-deoxy-manno-octulosonate cytidylyltransferase (CMP-KDO synthetase)
MAKAAVVIPARWSSTRFPGKPLHIVAGKPLLRHVWERAKRANVDAVIIATDDCRIVDAARNWGADVALTSAKHASGTDRVAEIARKNKQFQFVVNVQGDEPLIEPRLIEALIKQLRGDRSIGIVTAAHPFTNSADIESPHQVKVVLDRNSDALYFSRAAIPFRRASEPRYLRHQGIYGYRRDVLLQFVRSKPTPLERAESLEQLRALENAVRIHVLVTKRGTPGVDTPEDAAALEQILARAQGSKRQR